MVKIWNKDVYYDNLLTFGHGGDDKFPDILFLIVIRLEFYTRVNTTQEHQKMLLQQQLKQAIKAFCFIFDYY